jgi:polygalacturonase
MSLSCREVISEIKVSPERFGIRPASGKTATSFVLPGPGYYVVRINGKHKLFIFAELPETVPHENTIDVLSLGIDNKGIRTETDAIQRALNSVSGTGKTLVFPAGIYKTGSLSIPSNTDIYLSAGAILKGVDELSDFDFHDNIKPRSFIRIKDAEKVSISGRGVIDANGRMLRDSYADSARMRLLLVLNSRNVTVDGIFVRDPGSWNTHILHSENVTIQNVKMLNDIELSNTDGFDPDASQKVIIEKCFAYCSDDNVAVKITATSDYIRDVSNVIVRGCVFLTKKSSLKVGTESRGEVMKDILFENNDVVESDRGMALYCSDGAEFQNIRFINNRFEDNYPDSKQSWMNFTITKRNPDSKAGSMSEILIRDCSFLTAFPKASEIGGFDETHRILLTIDNLKVGGAICNNEKESNIKNKGFADIEFK